MSGSSGQAHREMTEEELKWHRAKWEKGFKLFTFTEEKGPVLFKQVWRRVYRQDDWTDCKDYYGWPKKEILETVTDEEMTQRTLSTDKLSGLDGLAASKAS